MNGYTILGIIYLIVGLFALVYNKVKPSPYKCLDKIGNFGAWLAVTCGTLLLILQGLELLGVIE